MFTSKRREILIFGLAMLATFALHLPSLLSPRLFYDDFRIFKHSWDAATTVINLWEPHNEHAMPLGRIAAWALLAIDPRLTTVAFRASLQGPLLAMLTAGLIYLFVRRELNRPFPALLAAILYGVSLKYQETIFWYAASFWVVGFDTILLALLAAQAWKQSGRVLYLILCVLACALSPMWYAGGILAGPLCVLYLLPQTTTGSAAWRGRALALIPMLGSVLFLLVSLPQNAQKILHAEHYGGRTTWEVFNPLFGLVCTGKAIVDVLFLNPTGTGGRTCPIYLVPVILIVLAAVAVWWNWRAPRVLPLLALGLIFGHYLLTFSPRSQWSYDNQMVSWTRYHLVPWLGMVLLFVNGFAPRPEVASQKGELGVGQTWILGLLTGFLFVLQFPVVWFSWEAMAVPTVQQHEVLLRIEAMDQRCRDHGISAEQARLVLDPLDIPMGEDPYKNAWDWLRGSDQPRELSPSEVRRLLAE